LFYNIKKHKLTLEITQTDLSEMKLSKLIEHTLLKPDASLFQIRKLCEESIVHSFAGVCIPPFYVPDAKLFLEESPVNIVTVVGFPMGYTAISSKVEEVKRAIDDGADEIDMVANICAVKDAKWAHVRNDIDSVTRATHLKGKIMKVILETALLSEDEIKKLCELCIELGVNYVKTSTGINGGASIESVKLLKLITDGTDVKIKASGGIKTKEFAEQLVLAGASRLGTSASLNIIK
jgi:deoxyribose-phosphate aldolase